VLERMSMALKSVCVSSLLVGPRSLLLGAAEGTLRKGEGWKHRPWFVDEEVLVVSRGVDLPESARWRQLRHCMARELAIAGDSFIGDNMLTASW